jgi:hypothetical protein
MPYAWGRWEVRWLALSGQDRVLRQLSYPSMSLYVYIRHGICGSHLTTRHLTARHLTTRHFSTRHSDNSPPWQLTTLTTRHSDNSPPDNSPLWQLATLTTRHPDNSPPLQLVTMAYMPGSVSLFWLFFTSMFALYCSPNFSFNIMQIFCSDQWDPTFITSF